MPEQSLHLVPHCAPPSPQFFRLDERPGGEIFESAQRRSTTRSTLKFLRVYIPPMTQILCLCCGGYKPGYWKQMWAYKWLQNKKLRSSTKQSSVHDGESRKMLAEQDYCCRSHGFTTVQRLFGIECNTTFRKKQTDSKTSSCP